MIEATRIDQLLSLDLDASSILKHLNFECNALIIFSPRIRHERNVSQKFCSSWDIETITSRRSEGHQQTTFDLACDLNIGKPTDTFPRFKLNRRTGDHA